LKWLQDPVKYLGESCGLVLEQHNEEIAAVQKRMAKAASDPGRLSYLARSEKRRARAQEYGVILQGVPAAGSQEIPTKRKPGSHERFNSSSRRNKHTYEYEQQQYPPTAPATADTCSTAATTSGTTGAASYTTGADETRKASN